MGRADAHAAQGEPGAGAFVRALREREVPVESLHLRADVDPIAFVRLTARIGRARPLLVHTHLVHADVFGLLAAAVAAAGPLLDQARLQRVPRAGVVRADRSAAARCAPADRDLAWAGALSGRGRGLRGGGASRSSTTGSTPAPSPTRAPERGRLLCVGRLIPIKGHIVLLRAFARAKRDFPDLQLDIAGRGPLEPALKAVAAELGIIDSGALPRPRQPDPGRRSSRPPSSSSRRWARASGWSRSRRWSARVL